MTTPPVVSWDWYLQRAGSVVLADVRRATPERSASAAHDAGHLPGAVLVDLDRWLAGPPSAERGRHPLPDPELFAAGMARAGIGDDDVVVAHDDEDGVVAARLVWMLRVTGHPAALLDDRVRPGDPRLVELPTVRPAAVFTPRPWPTAALAGPDDAVDPAAVVLDARSRDRYLGQPHPLDPVPGHLPGARSVPCLDNLDPRGRLLPDDVLRARFAAAGVREGADVVSTCGSGVTACHSLLLLEHLDLGRGRLYPGSWSQYANLPGRPVETGDPALRPQGPDLSTGGPAAPSGGPAAP